MCYDRILGVGDSCVCVMKEDLGLWKLCVCSNRAFGFGDSCVCVITEWESSVCVMTENWGSSLLVETENWGSCVCVCVCYDREMGELCVYYDRGLTHLYVSWTSLVWQATLGIARYSYISYTLFQNGIFQLSLRRTINRT